MNSPFEHLTTALADRYRLERELGQGGMATVYLAEDLKHHRQVAIKVLRPELAATLGPERFSREIDVVARLQHPNILPLHDSGEAGGFVYYVMPYVAGESLRDRISREGELPIADAVRILRDMVDALAFAHAQHVVHRDVKPDNVMLSGRHALVMDFGIAKAVSEAGGGTATTVGTALGTPAYMAPEQAAGDPHVDHRADIYAVGATAYEMVTGRPPFTGATSQAVIAAHIVKTAEPVDAVRRAVPAELAAWIMRCLEKHPADRWQSAEAMLPLLEGLVASSGAITPTPGRAPVVVRRRYRWWLAAGIAVLVIAAGGALFRFNQVGASGTLIGDKVMAADDRVVVAEFVNMTGDSTLDLTAATITDGLRTTLQQPRIIEVLGLEEMRDGYRRMDLVPGVVYPDSVTRELARREGAKAYILGSVSSLGSGYQLTARVIATVGASEVLTARSTARSADELLAAIDDLGRKLLTGIGESLRDVRETPSYAKVMTGSFAALEYYSAASREGGTRVGIKYLEKATALDSTFAEAWRRLGGWYSSDARYVEAQMAYERAYALRSRLSEAMRWNLEGRYHLIRGEPELAEAAYRAAEAAEPGEGLASLANFLLTQRRFAESESLSIADIRRHPGKKVSSASYNNAFEAQLAQRRFAAAESTMSLAIAHQKNRGAILSMHLFLAFAQHQFDSVLVLAESLPGVGNRPFWKCVVAAYRGQLREANKCVSYGLTVSRARVRFTGDSAAARHVGDSLTKLKDTQESYPGRIAILAEVGRLADARRKLADWQQSTNPDDPWYRANLGQAAGAIALAEGRPDSAAMAYLAWNRSALLTDEPQNYTRGLPEAAEAFDRAGVPDSAIALFERALALPSWNWIAVTRGKMLWYPMALRRLGELYEEKGNKGKAIDYYQQFIELWRNADPELQPQVREARRRLAALVSR